MSSINDFVIRFANVNGTGSASANSLIAKAIFRMGLTIGPKNMFPSNIQGLPTWFEIRISEDGFGARRGGVDLLVGMNRATISKDIDQVVAGGYVLYDSTKPLSTETKQRTDITFLPMPTTSLARESISNPRQRGLIQNMLYVGAICELIGIDQTIIKTLLAEQYAKKPKLIPINEAVLNQGITYARQHYPVPLPFALESKTRTDDPILIDGNKALALGCLYAGATVVGWYPITPSTSVIENFESLCQTYRINDHGEKLYAIVQGEDEIAACGIVLGAMWNGARAFTATSGPGISLMSELLGYAYYTELPLVLFNIQRCGPSTGMPTRSQQADLLLCAHASHGDTEHILLFPANPHECFQMASSAFDIAERYQTPVMVLSDLEIGMNEYVTPALKWPVKTAHTKTSTDQKWDRGKVLSSSDLDQRSEPFYRYLDTDGDGICYRTFPGTHPKGSYFTRGSGHDQLGRYTEDGEAYSQNLDRLRKKFIHAADHLPQPEITKSQTDSKKPATKALVLFGSTLEATSEAVVLLGKQKKPQPDQIRLRSWPLSASVFDLLTSYESLIVIEQNQDGQLKKLLLQSGRFFPGQLQSLCLYDGLPLEAQFLSKKLLPLLSSST